ncbi:uncharacterized protein LOC117219714 isoform X1 [Megalopta genalis]|uniref:uncharacterized protein LOC117219714 isoform X1 n=1 Tax=Megalopta genalis TaxID=115081 RepID=UPI003FD01E58
MFKMMSRTDALEEISTWTNNDVLCLLQRNGLEECCRTITKRQIRGYELLHLTEGKLTLWKSDLTPPLKWSLWNFIEEVRRIPEKFVMEKLDSQMYDSTSDSEPWTDFEDEGNEDSPSLPETQEGQSNPGKRSDQKTLQNSTTKKPMDGGMVGISSPKEEEQGTYANCVANYQEPRTLPTKNVSKLHNQAEKSLAEQLKEQLKLMNIKTSTTDPKHDSLQIRKTDAKPVDRSQPQKSFLYNALKPTPPPKQIPQPKSTPQPKPILQPKPPPKPNVPNQTQRRMAVPPPPEPKKAKGPPMIMEKPNKDLAKPSMIPKNLDLVANLPAQTEESEDEYEAFDEEIIEQNQKKNMFRVDSKQSLTSGNQSSVESVYQPPSITSFDEEEEYPYKIYESITEASDDNCYYLSPIQMTQNSIAPPPLPIKPSHSSASSSPTSSRTSLERSNERSPDKKSATLPHSNSYTSLSSDRATRPLPPPPEKHFYFDKPWFHNITRDQAIALITEQNTYGNPQDGYFLLRPSTTNVNNPLALVLWYKDRVYNVPVRKRPDNSYALGSAKVNEPSFASVDEIVMFYTREELVLHGGGELGRTKLTDTPPK